MYGEIEFKTIDEEDDFNEKHREEFMKMWVLDLIIGNFDRHTHNFLFSGDTLYTIDHSHSLSINFDEFIKKVNVYVGYYRFFDKELPTVLAQSINKFLENFEYQQILEDLLEEILGKDFAVACLKRIRLIGKMIVETGKINERALEYAKL